MTFGEKLKIYRKGLNLTQAEFAQKVGLGTNTIINYEKGNTSPRSKEVYKKIADAVGVPVEAVKDDDIEVKTVFSIIEKYRNMQPSDDIAEMADPNSEPKTVHHVGQRMVVENLSPLRNTRVSVLRGRASAKNRRRKRKHELFVPYTDKNGVTAVLKDTSDEELQRLGIKRVAPVAASPDYKPGGIMHRTNAMLAGDRISDEDRIEVMRILKKYEY